MGNGIIIPDLFYPYTNTINYMLLQSCIRDCYWFIIFNLILSRDRLITARKQ